MSPSGEAIAYAVNVEANILDKIMREASSLGNLRPTVGFNRSGLP